MDYQHFSDFEINKRVADIALNGTWHVKPSHPENKTGGWLYGSNCSGSQSKSPRLAISANFGSH